MAYIEHTSRNTIRRVHEFMSTASNGAMMHQALVIHVRDEMPLW